MDWNCMLFRVAGVLAVLRAADAFRYPLPSSSTFGRDLISKLGSTNNAVESQAVTTREETKEIEEGQFDWNKQWYPVLSLKHTDEGRAQPVQLLGKDLVVWRDKEGRWSCFDDRCPHRAAPLTEGRVEKDGTLMCAYHAWRFDADGKCLSIPQSESGGRDEAQPKACAKVYPTQVAQDIIWVWGENGPDAALESAMSSPALVEIPPGKKLVAAAITQRDLPYGWDFFMENVVDSSHVEVAHHGVMGNRYNVKPKPFKLVEGSLSKKGFAVEAEVEVGPGRGATSFIAPSLVKVGAKNLEDRRFQLVLYNIPTRPGWSRMVSYQATFVPEDSKAKGKMLISSTPGGIQPHDPPDWVQHLFAHKFIAQDLVFLHHQERTLAASGIDSRNYGNGVYVPTGADTGVITLRKWIATFTGGGPAWVAGCDRTVPPKEWKRDVLLDVYEQHTKNCTACLGALKRVKRLLTAAKTSAVVSLAWAVLRAARASNASTLTSALARNGFTLRAVFPGLAITFASLAAIKVLESLHGAFYTSPYHHQDND
ncbi:unnamed protein product [Ascophyllum nodosum]